MKDYTSRLQVLEKHFCMKPIPTIDQFKKAWAEADPLSRSVLAALAESGDFDGWGKSWSRYMTAVRGYLLQMGKIEPDAQSLRQLAKEMEEGVAVNGHGYISQWHTDRCGGFEGL